MKKSCVLIAAAAAVTAVFGANYSYTGNGADRNDWFDAGNWAGGGGATNWPTAADNALFTNAGKDMFISQVVAEHGQLQAGRGVANMVTILPGGVVTNLNQTVAGILNNGKGTLVVDGGSLVTAQVQINPAGTAGHIPSPESTFELKDGSVEVAADFLVGVNSPGTLKVSGGDLDIGARLRCVNGVVEIVGSEASITADSLNWGTVAGSVVDFRYVLGSDGSVSRISAGSATFAGKQRVVIDGTLVESQGETSVVLVELGSGTFGAAEFDAIAANLELVNVGSGSLSLSGDGKQLIFTGTPVGRYLAKAWEFNTVGDTEGWVNTTLNADFVGVGVSGAINGGETVLTCADVAGPDGRLYYNESLSPAGRIALGGDSWRTLEVRLRQLDANPDVPGVASRLFDRQGTIASIQNPALNLGFIENANPLCSVKVESDNWIVATYDVSGHGTNDLAALRIDPIGNAVNTNFNFEVDYVRLYAGKTQPPVVRQLAQAWEFNASGDAEGWHGLNMDGVAAAADIDGVEGVMTCADVTSNDPQSKYTNTVSVGKGAWDTLAFRARQLTGNPGDAGTASQAWNISGTLVVVQAANLGALSFANDNVVLSTNALDHWVEGVVDISGIGGDLNNIRLDFVGGDAAKNFEVDYIRLYKMERLTGYQYWAAGKGLTPANDDPGDDPDGDGFGNLYEFAFGGDPLDDADTGLLPAGAAAVLGGTNVLEYVYFRNASPYSGLAYTLQESTDLVYVPFADTTDYLVTGIGAFGSGLEAVTNAIPATGNAKFIQVKVGQQ